MEKIDMSLMKSTATTTETSMVVVEGGDTIVPPDDTTVALQLLADKVNQIIDLLYPPDNNV